MNRSIYLLRFLAAALMLLTISLCANSQVADTILSEEDTYSLMKEPTAPHNTEDIIRVRAPLPTNTDQTTFRKAYIKFNLFTYTKTIQSALLRLGIYQAAGTNNNDNASVYGLIDDSWTAASLTWENAPSNGEFITYQKFAGRSWTAPDTTYYLDITSYVKSELEGDKIVSICMQDDSTKGTDLRLVSSRNTVKPLFQRPALILTEVSTDVAHGGTAGPDHFQVNQNYPNPFNPCTRITFTLPHSGSVRISIANILGEEIRMLASGEMGAGSHELVWDTRLNDGRETASGMYFCIIRFGELSKTIKMLLLR